MNLPTYYDIGTASVANGSTTVTGVGSIWGLDAIMMGDLFVDLAQPLVPPQRIANVAGNGSLELAVPWPGATMTAAPYEIRYVGMIERSTAQSRRVLEQLADVKAWYDIIVADDAGRLGLESPTNPLRAGYRVLVKDDGVIWAKKTGAYGDWIGPIEFKGDTGDKGWSPQLVAEAHGERRVFKLAGYVGGAGTVPTNNVGQYLKADGTWTATIGDAADFRGESLVSRGDYSAVADYVRGNYVLDSGSSWVLTVAASTGHAPPALPTTSNAYWQLLVRRGIDGAGTVNSVVAGAGIDVDATDLTQPIVKLDSDAVWLSKGIGELYAVDTAMTGVNIPPTGSSLYRYILLTAGENGVGKYNEGALTSESVSGSAPLLQATSVISLSGSPVNGRTVRLINSERRVLRAGSAGAVEADAFQGHKPKFGAGGSAEGQTLSNSTNASYSLVWPASGGLAQSPYWSLETDGTNGTPRIANETRAKSLGITYFMRIK